MRTPNGNLSISNFLASFVKPYVHHVSQPLLQRQSVAYDNSYETYPDERNYRYEDHSERDTTRQLQLLRTDRCSHSRASDVSNPGNGTERDIRTYPARRCGGTVRNPPIHPVRCLVQRIEMEILPGRFAPPFLHGNAAELRTDGTARRRLLRTLSS